MPASILDKLLDINRRWSKRMMEQQPDFFKRIAEVHEPEFLWIGCSDGRVGPDKLLELPPGSIFVHRNIGNVFASNDLNCLAVLQYAVEVLKVPNIVVCGHYGCGGIRQALSEHGGTAIDIWTDQIRAVHRRFRDEISRLPTPEAQADRLTELNVICQVESICHTSIIQEAWTQGQQINVIGLVYDIHDGLLRSLGIEYGPPGRQQA